MSQRDRHCASRHRRDAGPHRHRLSARHDRHRAGRSSRTRPTAAWSRTSSGQVVGSALIGQSFDATRRTSGRGRRRRATRATTPTASSGSNLGPDLAEAARPHHRRPRARSREANPDAPGPVPVELVTASASGLDPHLSPAGGRCWQVPRVARARGVDARTRVRAASSTRRPRAATSAFLGEPRVNVLLLNLALDRQFGAPPAPGDSAGAHA